MNMLSSMLDFKALLFLDQVPTGSWAEKLLNTEVQL